MASGMFRLLELRCAFLMSTVFDFCVVTACHRVIVCRLVEFFLFLGHGLRAPARDAKNEEFAFESVVLFVSVCSRLVDEAFRYEVKSASCRSDMRQYHACTRGRSCYGQHDQRRNVPPAA